MATISTATDERIVTINRWYGMNEAPDGDTKLKYGEASVMQNFCITRDGNLHRRNGQRTVLDLETNAPVKCLWAGLVDGFEIVLSASNGKMYIAYNGTEWEAEELGAVNTSVSVSVIAFEDKAYILDGEKYRELYYDVNHWVYQEVDGYRPLILTVTAPGGGGTALEQINKLNGKRRVKYSPDGTSTTYVLPEKPISSVDYVAILGVETEDYTVDLINGTVTFTTAPSGIENAVEIGYTFGTTFRSQVERMRYAELYNGTQDSRVFIYGDGSNEAFYSGLDEDGNPRGDYFPDMNEVAVGEENTPITAMIRHSSRLICFKSNSTWTITYTTITKADGLVTAGFTVVPVNKSIGNVAIGQAQLVLNYPRTLFGNDVYEWKNSSSYSSMLTADERQAKRISDRIQSSLGVFNLSDSVCFDDNYNQEYYICYNKMALVHNYVADAWYYYTNFDALCLCSLHGELYFGNSLGKIVRFTDAAKSDDGEPIEAYWESGAMDFKRDWMRKYTSNIWVVVKPETSSYVEITLKTDRKSEFATKTISRGTSGFSTWDFRSFSFNDNTQPQIKKLKLKAKKYVYYKIIFQSNEPETTATILSVDIKVRETGYAK